MSIAMKKALIFLLILVFPVVCPVFAQQRRVDPWWVTLEEGKRHFRTGSYGNALRLFEEARESRKDYFAKKERDLIAVLSLHTVRRLGDDLALAERYIEREFRVDAADALKELYYRVPKSRLNNSSNAALAELGRLKNYPEADYWLAEVYRMEGEFGIALNQYQKAYDQREMLENPEFGIEILYKMAELRRLRREYTEMIKIYEDILKTDALWSRESFNRPNMLRSLENAGVSRFLVLFRHNEPVV
jgi:tetratricopeptide (TPR) repeat protein